MGGVYDDGAQTIFMHVLVTQYKGTDTEPHGQGVGQGLFLGGR